MKFPKDIYFVVDKVIEKNRVQYIQSIMCTVYCVMCNQQANQSVDAIVDQKVFRCYGPMVGLSTCDYTLFVT